MLIPGEGSSATYTLKLKLTDNNDPTLISIVQVAVIVTKVVNNTTISVNNNKTTPHNISVISIVA